MSINLHIEAALNGSESGFKSIYEQTAGYLYGVIKNYIQDTTERKDVLQEVFIEIFKSLKLFDPSKGNFKAWASKIAARKCILLLNEKKRLNLQYLDVIKADFITEEMMPIISIDHLDIEVMLKEMPTGFRTVFLLYEIDGFSHNEISKMLGITPETSRSQLSRAIKWLKTNFSQLKLFNSELAYEKS